MLLAPCCLSANLWTMCFVSAYCDEAKPSHPEVYSSLCYGRYCTMLSIVSLLLYGRRFGAYVLSDLENATAG